MSPKRVSDWARAFASCRPGVAMSAALWLAAWVWPLSAYAVPAGQVDGTKVDQFIPKPKKLALVIGINEYRHRHWGRLAYAARDARRMAAMLQRGGFAHIIRLTTRKETSLASIKRSITALKKRNQSPGDTVVVYISAHGTLLEAGRSRRGRRYIVAADTDDEAVARTGLHVGWLRQAIESFVSRRKALILATCHTPRRGSKYKRVRGQKGTIAANLMPNSRTMLLLNAASYRYAAYESKQLRSDVYTHFLLDCIRRKRSVGGQKARVSAFEAHRCAVKKTYRYVLKHRGVEQLPGLVADVRGLNAVYFVGQPRPRNAVLGLPHRPASLASKGDRPVVQLSRRVLQAYKVVLYRIDASKPGKPDKIDEFVHPSAMVATLQPGTYLFAFVSRGDARRRKVAKRTLTLDWGQRLLLSPFEERRHVFSLSGGISQVGQGNFRALHPQIELGYRWLVTPRFFAGISSSYFLGQTPMSQATFTVHRWGLLQLEGGVILWSNDFFSLALGLHVAGGLEHTISVSQDQASTAPYMSASGLLDATFWLHRHVGVRLDTRVGAAFSWLGTPPTIIPSPFWRASLALLVAL